jgi:hypothetical protein
MPLPSPDDYDDWREFARALMGSLGDGTGDVIASGIGSSSGGNTGGVVGVGGTIEAPEGFDFVYWNGSLADLFVGHDILTAPDIVTPFQIDTQSLALASVELDILAAGAVDSTKLVDGAVVSAKIIDLAVINAKIANATILSAKIGDLQVLTAKIADLQVLTAKIGDLQVNTLQVANAAISAAKIANLAVGAANIIIASIGSAQIQDASIATADIGAAQITTALIGTAAITSALILDATIASADIGAAQIVQAAIGALAVGSAQIQDASIVSAKIADLAVTAAKIASLTFDKMTAGTLDAVIDMGSGLIRFTIGGNKLVMGKGFGTSSQFFMWFGPSMAESAMSESTAVFYLKTDGSAYFGGDLIAGTQTNSVQTTILSPTADVVLGPFGTLGHNRQYTVNYQYQRVWTIAPHSGLGSPSGSMSVLVTLQRWNPTTSVWDTLTSSTASGGVTDYTPADPPGASADNGTEYDNIFGSISYTDTSHTTADVQLRAVLSSFTDGVSWSGGGGDPRTVIGITQRLSIQSVES